MRTNVSLRTAGFPYPWREPFRPPKASTQFIYAKGDQWQTLHQLQDRQTLFPSHFINIDLFVILCVTVGCLANGAGRYFGEILKEASESRAVCSV